MVVGALAADAARITWFCLVFCESVRGSLVLLGFREFCSCVQAWLRQVLHKFAEGLVARLFVNPYEPLSRGSCRPIGPPVGGGAHRAEYECPGRRRKSDAQSQ